MITIPTGDLLGILNDAIPFACPHPELPDTHCVRIEWDGQLHTLASDLYHHGWSSWDPDDGHDDEHQDSLFTDWGGADEPWTATVRLGDAVHLTKTYKLGAKQYFTPLTVERTTDGLRIMRNRESGHSAISTVLKDAFVKFPDLRNLLTGNDKAKSVTALDFSAESLSHFAKVRPRGPVCMSFHGPGRLVRVRIGERFLGGIQPIKNSERLGQVDLKTSTGLVTAAASADA